MRSHRFSKQSPFSMKLLDFLLCFTQQLCLLLPNFVWKLCFCTIYHVNAGLAPSVARLNNKTRNRQSLFQLEADGSFVQWHPTPTFTSFWKWGGGIRDYLIYSSCSHRCSNPLFAAFKCKDANTPREILYHVLPR